MTTRTANDFRFRPQRKFGYNRLRRIGRFVRFAHHKLPAPKNAILIDIGF